MTRITLLWALLHDNWGFSFSCDYSSGAALLGNASETIIWLKQLPWILVSQSWSLCRTHSVCVRGLCLSIKADLCWGTTCVTSSSNKAQAWPCCDAREDSTWKSWNIRSLWLLELQKCLGSAASPADLSRVHWRKRAAHHFLIAVSLLCNNMGLSRANKTNVLPWTQRAASPLNSPPSRDSSKQPVDS